MFGRNGCTESLLFSQSKFSVLCCCCVVILFISWRSMALIPTFSLLSGSFNYATLDILCTLRLTANCSCSWSPVGEDACLLEWRATRVLFFPWLFFFGRYFSLVWVWTVLFTQVIKLSNFSSLSPVLFERNFCLVWVWTVLFAQVIMLSYSSSSSSVFF